MKLLKLGFFFLMASFFLMACGGSAADSAGEKPQSMLQKDVTGLANKGIGPVKEVVINTEIDLDLAAKGEEMYKKKGCVACHKPDEKLIGPPPKDVLKRRSPEWVMNLIMNPEEMQKKDPDAKKLLEEYNNVPMTNQNVTEEEARAMLEYFRTL